MFPVAILAGGLGTRLHPLTEQLPKSLVPIAGRPFIFHQLELLHDRGVRQVVLCVGHLAQQIEAAVGEGGRFGLEAALPRLGSDFFVLYGDSYLPCSFAAAQGAYEAARRPALMTVLRNDDRWDRSNVALRSDGSIEYSKGSRRTGLSHIDFGLSVLCAQVLQRYPESAFLDLADLWGDLSARGQLAALEVTGRFYEIGSRQGIADLEAHLLQRRAIA